MAEVGLVRFAAVALEVATLVVPLYRTRFSNHLYTQPQLLTLLCLMRYEDWTFREVEVRLLEHSDLRAVLGLKRVPDHTTLYRFLRRMRKSIIDRAMEEVARRLPPPTTRGTTVAVDATGLAPGAISTFFVKRACDPDLSRGFPWRHYLKWLVAVDVPRRIVLAQVAKRGPTNDSATLRPLVNAAQSHTPIPTSRDAELDSERNHRHIREVMGAHSLIPAKRGKSTWTLRGYRAQMRSLLPSPLYSQRALVETVFSVVKWKLSARAPGRSTRTQRLQAMLLGMPYNIYRLAPCPNHLPSAPAPGHSRP